VSRCRLLFIDDDDAMLRVVEAALDDGAQVVGLAHNAKEAYRLYLEQRPDLVLVDLMLPGEGGLDIAAQLMEVAPGLPVILLTAYLDDAVQRRALQVGIRACVAKENLDQLLATVSEHCPSA
jgi:CheY-like chemotaxis protein